MHEQSHKHFKIQNVLAVYVILDNVSDLCTYFCAAV